MSHVKVGTGAAGVHGSHRIAHQASVSVRRPTPAGLHSPYRSATPGEGHGSRSRRDLLQRSALRRKQMAAVQPIAVDADAGPAWFARAIGAVPDERWVSVAGARIHYRAWGPDTGPGVVLVH